MLPVRVFDIAALTGRGGAPAPAWAGQAAEQSLARPARRARRGPVGGALALGRADGLQGISRIS